MPISQCQLLANFQRSVQLVAIHHLHVLDLSPVSAITRCQYFLIGTRRRLFGEPAKIGLWLSPFAPSAGAQCGRMISQVASHKPLTIPDDETVKRPGPH